jgi:hypothetical protein
LFYPPGPGPRAFPAPGTGLGAKIVIRGAGFETRPRIKASHPQRELGGTTRLDRIADAAIIALR